jgi:hypothetical protein
MRWGESNREKPVRRLEALCARGSITCTCKLLGIER